MLSIEYNEAATEVLEILDNTNKEDIEKIPKIFIEFLKQNSSKSYKPNIDYSKPIEEMNLKKKTIDILALICSKYWCDDMQKIEFINRLELNEKIQQEKLEEKYNIENLFKERKPVNVGEEILVLDNKKNFITKLINKINKLNIKRRKK